MKKLNTLNIIKKNNHYSKKAKKPKNIIENGY
jgi:hypothetical protein